MIPRARGDDAAKALLGAQIEQPVERAAILERTRALQVLHLQEQRARKSIAQPERRNGGSMNDARRDTLARGVNVGDAWHTVTGSTRYISGPWDARNLLASHRDRSSPQYPVYISIRMSGPGTPARSISWQSPEMNVVEPDR